MHGPLDVQLLVPQANEARIIGRRVELYDSVASTNTLALERAGEPGAHGLVILAEHQHAGRGRWNRTWHSPRGASVLCTALVICKPQDPQARGIQLWPALAVRQALAESCDVQTQIKWPNDLLVGRRKLSGILIESRPLHAVDRDASFEGQATAPVPSQQAARATAQECRSTAPGSHPGSAQPGEPRTLRAFAIGIGINCLQHARHFPPELIDRATSLDLVSPDPIDRVAVTRALIACLDRTYQRATSGALDELKREWLEHAVAMGERVEILSEGRRYTGRLIDLDLEEGLVVQLESGGRRLFSAQTSTIQLAG